jgi:hypothetical protein
MRCDSAYRYRGIYWLAALDVLVAYMPSLLSFYSILSAQTGKKGLYIRKHLTGHWRSGPGVRASTRTQAISSICRARARCTTTDSFSTLASDQLSGDHLLPQPQPAAGVAPRPSGRPHLALAASATQVVPRDSDTSLALAQAQGQEPRMLAET